MRKNGTGRDWAELLGWTAHTVLARKGFGLESSGILIDFFWAGEPIEFRQGKGLDWRALWFLWIFLWAGEPIEFR